MMKKTYHTLQQNLPVQLEVTLKQLSTNKISPYLFTTQCPLKISDSVSGTQYLQELRQ